METLKFEKWQGLGNDFVIISEVAFPEKGLADWARILCDRRFGIGGDGLVWIGKSDREDFKMVIQNSDGSPADMCGNALRCAVAYVYEKGIVPKPDMTIETDAGIKTGNVQLNAEGKIEGIKINMGKPIWEPEKIPMNSKEVKEVPLEAAGQTFLVTGLNTGVPHGVVFVENFDWDWHTAGQELMVHPAFPLHTNVDFIQVLADDHLLMKVWERGAGPTLACGTGACAAAVAAAATGKAGREVRVTLDGGDLQIAWDEADFIWMTGPAQRSFCGMTDLIK